MQCIWDKQGVCRLYPINKGNSGLKELWVYYRRCIWICEKVLKKEKYRVENKDRR